MLNFPILYFFIQTQDMQEINQTIFNTAACKGFIEQQFTNSALPSLKEYIRIDNMSKGFYKPEEWHSVGWPKLSQAADHIYNWIINAKVKGLRAQIIENKEKDLTPIIFVEIDGDLPQTYFFYGHFDKQPPFVGWNEGLDPYEPVLYPSVQNPQKLYGRGGADDGYSSYGSILAVKALQSQGIPIPRCVMIFQGDEQTSSGDVQRHVLDLKQRIGNPKLIFCLDSGANDYQRLWVTTSLRGMINLTVKVDILRQGVHSGDASGMVPSSFRIFNMLLERLEDKETGRMVQALDVDIPPNRYKEIYNLAKQKGEGALKGFETVQGLQRISENVLQSLILNGWKAQLSVIGANGLPSPTIAGNVMLPFTEARLSIRLPPTKNPEQAKNFIIKTLTQNPPYNAKITISGVRCGAGFNAAQFPPILTEALKEAGQSYFEKEPLSLAEGVSIPFLTFLGEQWPKAQFIVTGVLGPQSNAHGPNQFLHIPYVKSLICSMAHVMAKTAGKL